MARTKKASKRNRPKIGFPVWGAAGMSLAMAGGASAGVAPTADTTAQRAALPSAITLGEEELSDVNLFNILCLRPGSRNGPARREGRTKMRQRLRRLPGLRGPPLWRRLRWLQGLRGPPLWRLRDRHSLRSLQLQLLPVVGSLPDLLSTFRLR